MVTSTPPRKIGIVIYQRAQALDITGPHEVFASASQVPGDSGPPYEVFLIAASRTPVEMTSRLKEGRRR